MKKSLLALFGAFAFAGLSVSAGAATNESSSVPGVVVAHSPKSSKVYIGSPGLVALPNGDYLAKWDEFGPGSTEKVSAVTRVYRSKNRGQTWEEISRVDGMFWGSSFAHRDAVYLLGTHAGHRFGNVVIRRSVDGGKTWTDPKDGESGRLLGDLSYTTAPMPVIEYRGRLWRAMEDEKGPAVEKGWPGRAFRPFMMSAPVDADLLQASSWTFSNPLASDPDWLPNADFGAWLEGNVVIDPEGGVVDVLRVQTKTLPEKAAIVRFSADGKTATFDPKNDIVNFPGGSKKFTIRHDAKSGLYWSLTNYVPPVHGDSPRYRNTVALLSSPDLKNWEVRCVLLYHPQHANHGFQYLDWIFEGDDMIALSRTAFEDGQGGARSTHDANYLTFHRWKNFRQLTLKDSVVPLEQLGLQ
ncbi:exo-alpha-sialidase [Oleiharenicola lentus]|uniref:exo-alpha-sialidase n=1 Tax=Oleiharenicola lentus TaxID=2508720 RepID=UPI003F67D6C8